MRNFFRFLFSGRVWMNIILIITLISLLVWGVLLWLNSYTQHGESIAVPDMKGYPTEKLDVVLANLDLRYEIVDSIYSDDEPRGVVVSQNPPPDQQVKRGRTIFLTVNSMLPEMVAMPDLVGKSKRIALPLLEIAGLKIASLEYRPDESCTDCVIGQLYAGQPVEAGTMIRKGEAVTLVLGRESNVFTTIPDLTGMTYTKAYETLSEYSLNTGMVMSCIGCETADDTAAAYVVNQRPTHSAEARLGTFVDLYLDMDSTSVSNIEEPVELE